MPGSLDVCGHTGCRKPLRPPLLQCERCKAVAYCSKECQTRAWKAGHKRECAPGDGRRVVAAAAAQARRALPQQAAGITSDQMRLLAQIKSLWEAHNWKGLATLERKACDLAGNLRGADPGIAYFIYGSMGVAFDKLGQYRKAMELHEECKAIAEELGDRADVGGACNNLGVALVKTGELAAAARSFASAIAAFRQVEGDVGAHDDRRVSVFEQQQKAYMHL